MGPSLRAAALAAVAVLLAGCVGSPGAEGDPTTPTTPPSGDAGPTGEPHKGGFRVLETGWASGLATDGFEGRVLRDQAAWEAFWEEHRAGHGEPGAPPAVDFATEVAVAVLMGERTSGGHSIEVLDVATRDAGFVVRYATASPGPGCATAAVVSHPYQLVAAKAAADATMAFEQAESRVRDC